MNGEGLAEGLEGIIELAEGGAGVRKGDEGFDAIGIKFESTACEAERLGMVMEVALGGGEILDGIDMVGLSCDDFLKNPGRVAIAAGFRKSDGVVHGDGGVVGLKGDGVAMGGDGFGEVGEADIAKAEVTGVGGVGGSETGGTFEKREGVGGFV